MPGQPEFQQRLQSIERLLAEIEGAADPNLRASVQELVQLVMDLHGGGIERMLELIRAAGEQGESVVQKLGRDDLVASLLVLYGLHPVNLEDRVAQAVEKARSRVRPREAEVELLSLQDGAVRLRLRANGHGCGSTAQALKEIVENVIYQGAPDIASLVIEGAEEKQGFVSLEMLQATAPSTHMSNGFSLTAAGKAPL
jgi:Fe-S cluster biogenesis protein NfuA